MTPEQFKDFINSPLILGESAYRSDPRRAFDGQPHTNYGTSGAQVVCNIRMRDIYDCCIRAIFLSANGKTIEQLENYEYVESEVYDLDFSRIDPIAIAQNLTCEINRMVQRGSSS